jgi:hypothetical protein
MSFCFSRGLSSCANAISAFDAVLKALLMIVSSSEPCMLLGEQ